MKILLIEDDPADLSEVRPVCADDDVVEVADTLASALKFVEEAWPDVIICDAIFPPFATPYPDRYKQFMVGSLIDRLSDLSTDRKRKPPRIILISGAAEAAEHFAQIVDWLSVGHLYDVVPKAGFGNWEFFRAVLAHRLNELRRNVQFARVLQKAKQGFAEMASCDITTQDPAMLSMWETIKRHSSKNHWKENLFISGEMGVGKELVAKAIARLSGTDFLAFNCNTTETLFFSEMFGSVRGAFNDAQNRPGLIEQAGNGVLFLDQFCSISSSAQFQLLRVLEENTREYKRLGETRIRIAQCKFIIADTISPKEALRAASEATAVKKLIPEMYSRLAFGSVTVPPLRDRRDDVPLLLSHFLDRFSRSRNRVRFDDDLLDKLTRGAWNGNVRALHDFVRVIAEQPGGIITWSDVTSVFDPDILELQVGKHSCVQHDETLSEEDIKSQIRLRLNAEGISRLQDLERKLANEDLDVDPQHVYKVLYQLSKDRSQRIYVSDGKDLVGTEATQFKKALSVLYESSAKTFNGYHRVNMIEERKRGNKLEYVLLDTLYV